STTSSVASAKERAAARQPAASSATSPATSTDSSSTHQQRLDKHRSIPTGFSGDPTLVALDCAVDTSTPAGEAMAPVLATFGQFERRLIGQRTREALAAKKASGVRLGRPPTVPQAVVRRMQRQRARGDSLRKIADDLNEARVPTAQGGAHWYAATVTHVLIRTS